MLIKYCFFIGIVTFLLIVSSHDAILTFSSQSTELLSCNSDFLKKLTIATCFSLHSEIISCNFDFFSPNCKFTSCISYFFSEFTLCNFS